MLRTVVGSMAGRVPIVASRAFAPTLAGRDRAMTIIVSKRMVEQVMIAAKETPFVNAIKMDCDGVEPVLFSYAGLLRQIDAFGNGLLSGQFKPGHKIVIWGKDCLEIVIAQAGVIRAGLTAECLPANATDEQLAKALEGARALLISPTLLPNEEALETLYRVIPEMKKPDDMFEVRTHQTIEAGQFPKLRFIFNTGWERRFNMMKFAFLLYYQPQPSLVTQVTELGSVSYSGSDSPTDLTLPYFDPNAKMDPVPEDDHKM
mmetsp:Transcript_60634/g.138575  ORF Transcript_60634/g.138575 Transcript_60634/m.138575 type:complete len:260 (-) Transcript_60634:41-820(-)